MERVIHLDGHNIGITSSSFGHETISHDGVTMSKGFSIMGGTHVFTVKEGESTATYEVRLRGSKSGMSCQVTIKKNGVEVHTEAVSTAKTAVLGWVVATVIFLFVVLPSLGALKRAVVAEAPKITNEQMIALRNTAKRNSVMVVATHKNGASKGSGFVIKRIGDKAIVATNAHVVLDDGGASPTSVVVKPLGANEFVKADLLYAQRAPGLQLDLALLVVRDPTNKLGQEVQFAKSVEEGELAISVGSPLNEEFTIDDGVVQRVESSADLGNVIFHDALIEHGSSGGGLFNAKGELLGINTYILEDGKTGVALSNDLFLNRLKLYSVKVSANEDWQNSGIQISPSNHLVIVLAQGKWSVSSWVSPLDALGTTEYAEYSLFPALAHGSLLMSLDGGNSAVAIDQWWNGAVREASTYLSQPVDNKNTNISFRNNDADIKNNEGQIDVTVLVW